MAGEIDTWDGTPQHDDLRWLTEPPLYWIVEHSAPLPLIPGLAYLATNRYDDSAYHQTLVATPDQPDLIELLRSAPGIHAIAPGYLRYFFQQDTVIAVVNGAAITWFDSVDEALQWDPFADPDTILPPGPSC
ncbi:MAG: hypothetical protein NZL87_00775 [Thermomicrobium sp.]|nr:hypothetical protein [Thermomicrobium sp.]